MNWLDLLVIVILVGAVIVETMRGFGKAVFDALIIYGVLWLAFVAAPPFAKAMPMSNNSSMAMAYAYGIVATAGIGIGLVLSRFAYGSLLPHAGMFDHFLGLVLGVFVGMMFSHALVKTVHFSDQAGTDPSTGVVATGPVASEMYDFHNYHSVVDQITGIESYHREISLGNDDKK